MYRVLFLKIKGICFVEVSYRDFFYSVSLLIVSVIYTICPIAWIGLLTHSVLIISIAQVYLFQKNWQYFDNKASPFFGRTSAGIVLCFVGFCLTLSVLYLCVCACVHQIISLIVHDWVDFIVFVLPLEIYTPFGEKWDCETSLNLLFSKK